MTRSTAQAVNRAFHEAHPLLRGLRSAGVDHEQIAPAARRLPDDLVQVVRRGRADPVWPIAWTMVDRTSSSRGSAA